MRSSATSTLLEAAQKGDREALESLLSAEQGRIYRFGMKMCRHEQDAEDVLQETMLAAARSISDFQGDSSLSTWLYTIARSFCVKKRRQGKFAPRKLESLESQSKEVAQIAHPGRSPADAAQNQELQQALDRAMAGLDVEHREVVLLRDVEGLEASEVAKVLGVSSAAVKSRLHRARARLRELLIPALEEAPPAGRAACPDVLKLYSQELEGELSAELCAQTKQHLDGCAPCRATCDALKQTLVLCEAYREMGVPAASVR